MSIASGLIPDGGAQLGRYVRVKKGVKGFVEGGRYVTPMDPPFMVPDHRAGDLLKAGLVEICERHSPPSIEMPQHQVNEAQARAEKAVQRR